MSIRFDDRVAIVTGAGGGLGRRYALDLAARGAKVVVNDLGSAVDGKGSNAGAAQAVVDEIKRHGGEAMASGASVTNAEAVAAMVEAARAKWGRVDILVNNAGVLRDKSFGKMTLDDFRFVLEVHLMGSVTCTKAVWNIMREQNYGRILMATSGSGLYGNFGQTNYGAAKMALVGFMKTLALEGAKHGIHANCIAPLAATRMTNDVMPPELLARIGPEAVSPAAVYLVSEEAPTGVILNAGGGGFEASNVTITKGIHLGQDQLNADVVAARIDEILERDGEQVPQSLDGQTDVALGALDKAA